MAADTILPLDKLAAWPDLQTAAAVCVVLLAFLYAAHKLELFKKQPKEEREGGVQLFFDGPLQQIWKDLEEIKVGIANVRGDIAGVRELILAQGSATRHALLNQIHADGQHAERDHAELLAAIAAIGKAHGTEVGELKTALGELSDLLIRLDEHLRRRR